MEEKGFIILYRKLIDWEWYDHIPTKVLFIHLLLKANHTTKLWRGNEIKRGQYLTSLNTLSKETGLSVKQVRSALNNLEKTGEVGKQTTSLNTLISITKYKDYQTKGTPRANDGQSKGKPMATTNNVNNVNNDYNEEQIKEKKEKTFNFRLSLIDLGVNEKIVEDWIKVRKTKNATNTETAFNKIKSQILKSGKTANECITLAVEKDWKGFEAEWIKNTNYSQKDQPASHVHTTKKETIADFGWDEFLKK